VHLRDPSVADLWSVSERLVEHEQPVAAAPLMMMMMHRGVLYLRQRTIVRSDDC
jgi:hypothetical protein